MSLLTVGMLIAGLALLVGGAEALVRGASRLALALGISPLVVGLTVVAFGTSAPEMAVSTASSLHGQADIALGNVIGSNIFNVLLILGLSAVIAPLLVNQQLIRLDVPLMIGASVAVWLLAADGNIGRGEALLLFGGIVVYTVFLVWQSRREQKSVQDEYADEFGARPPRTVGAWIVNLGLLAVGLGMLVLGSRWLVNGAVEIAAWLGVSQLIIGLTIIAAGTSLPEVATSVLASLRGERDIAVGNVVGSNLFNLLAVLGLAGIAAPGGVAVASHVLYFDMAVMVAVAVACLPIFFTGHLIARWEGFIFLGYYVAYTAYVVMAAQESSWQTLFGDVMLYFAVPLTVLTLGIAVWRAMRGTTGLET